MKARKLITATCSAALTTIGLTAATYALSETRDTNRSETAPVDKVLVPVGLTNQDTVELTLAGFFPNTCYSIATARADIDAESMIIRLTAEASHQTNALCAQVMTPFIETLQVGPLTEGTYTIYVVDRPEAEVEPLVIDSGEPTGEENLYAPVDRARVTRDDSGQAAIEVGGTYPFTLVGCMTLEEMTVTVEPGDVIVVEPHAVFADDEDRRCVDQRDGKAFAAKAKLDEPLASGIYLLQVRTMNDNVLQQVVAID